MNCHNADKHKQA